MKKILLFSVLVAIAVASCKKYSNPSITVTASYPTITPVNGNIYFTMPVNGTLPTPSQVATAYDSFYQTSLTVVLIDSTVHTFTPGLYTATATAQNKYGYLSTETYFVAVTNLPAGNLNLAGTWKIGTSDSFDNYITPLVTDYYTMSNVAGTYPPSGGISANFAVIDDSTIAFTDALFGYGGALSLVPADTTVTTPYGAQFTKYH